MSFAYTPAYLSFALVVVNSVFIPVRFWASDYSSSDAACRFDGYNLVPKSSVSDDYIVTSFQQF
jgi:hypothetical protein